VIALDTNVLVRFLVEDDVQQSARAAAMVQSAIDAQQSLFVSDVVVCEVVWVLERAYGVARGEIAATLGKLLFARHLAFRKAELLRRALAGFQSGRGDFADYVIREHAFEAGCDAVVTFDRALLRERGFRRA
jgi:predicted nucleic-acid-binding protein